MSYSVEKIHFIELGQFSFMVSFLYKGQNLQTGELPKELVAGDSKRSLKMVSDAMIMVCREYDQRSGGELFVTLMKTFEGTSQTLEA